MRHKRAGSKLGRVTAHREALFRSLLTALFRHERVTTTVAKAKAIRPLADQVVTLSKRDDLHARRQVLGLIADGAVVRRLFDTVAARYADRRGGYTRIVPVGTRRGDGAPVAILELVDRPETPKADKDKGRKAKEPSGKEAKKARRAAEAAARHG
jgi:large subunit ribosomal protein L17